MSKLRYHYVRKTPNCPCCESPRIASFFCCPRPELVGYYFYIHLKHGEYIEPIFSYDKKENDFLCLECGLEFSGLKQSAFLTNEEFKDYLEEKCISKEDISDAKDYWKVNRPDKVKKRYKQEKIKESLTDIVDKFKRKGR